jgi:hypothetical protein
MHEHKLFPSETEPLSHIESVIIALIDNSVHALRQQFLRDEDVKSNTSSKEDSTDETAAVASPAAVSRKDQKEGTKIVTKHSAIKVFILHEEADLRSTHDRETDHGDVSYIVVADNGCGVSPEDAGFTAQNALETADPNNATASAGIFKYGVSNYQRSSAAVDSLFSGELSVFGKGLKLMAADESVRSFRFIARAPLGTLQEFEQHHGSLQGNITSRFMHWIRMLLICSYVSAYISLRICAQVVMVASPAHAVVLS